MGAYVAAIDTATACLLEALWRRAFRGRFVLASGLVAYGEGLYRSEDHGKVRPRPRTEDDLVASLYDPCCPTPAAPAECGGRRSTRPRLPNSRNIYAATEPYAEVAWIFRSSLARGEAPRVFAAPPTRWPPWPASSEPAVDGPVHALAVPRRRGDEHRPRRRPRRPAVVLALLLAARRRPGWAGALLGAAAVVSLYPAVLLAGWPAVEPRWTLVVAPATRTSSR